MLLNFTERFMLLESLPPQGNLITIRSVQAIHDLVALSDEEMADAEVTQIPGGGLKWDRTKETDKEVSFTGPQTKVIVERLQELDAKDELVRDHLTLCEKFDIGNG